MSFFTRPRHCQSDDGALLSVNAALVKAWFPADLCRMHIDHIALWVRNLEGMRAFYETYFSAVANSKCTNVGKGYSAYFLTFPDGGPRLELMQMPGIPDSGADAFAQFLGLIHFAVSVGTEEAVDALTAQLQAAGLAVVSQPRCIGDGYYESVVLDPEQNRIELTV